MRCLGRAAALLSGLLLAAVTGLADQFRDEIRPVLAEYCSDCHGPGSDNPFAFLEARSAADVSAQRGLWSDVAMQLRNRTMPPAGPQPPEGDRFRIATWIDSTLRGTACDLGDHAGPVAARRLNRTEYENTVRDLFGLRFELAELFPVDGSGGEGFDNHAETLYMSPLLAERYLEVAQRVLDAVIITPPLGRSFTSRDLFPDRPVDEDDSIELLAGDAVTRQISAYENGDYDVRASIKAPHQDALPTMEVLSGGARVGRLRFAWSAARATSARTHVALSRGLHSLTLRMPEGGVPLRLVSVDVSQRAAAPDESKRSAHFRLFAREPGETVLDPGGEARRLLGGFMEAAFRRPLRDGEAEPYLSLFRRSADRGDPFEASIRTALKAVLVSPDFLYRIERAPDRPGLHPLSDHELASRLSYFLWGSMPDSELRQLADAGALQDDDALAAQVDRLLDHPRSRHFARAFIGQWLGTKDIGGRVAPTLNEIQHFYTPRIAADMREEPVLLFQRMLRQDRSLLEFVNADYTYLTERLARHYGMPGAVRGNDFRLVSITDGRRGGLPAMGGVQAMNSAYKRTSPVLRGVWVLDTLLGTRIPAPPPETPSLETEEGQGHELTAREMLAGHRANPSCAACHDLIDPIGFAFEHYDWLGRWRDRDGQGRPVDASGALPSGEEFDGLDGLRQVLLGKKEELLRQVTRKVLGYALGRGIADRDQCTIETIVRKIAPSGYGARTLVREIALSVPFRYTQAAHEGDRFRALRPDPPR